MSSGQRWTLITVGVALLSFGIGAGWQYARAADFESELTARQRELTFQRLENSLAAATIEAQRGRHEAARQLASGFFSGLQDSLDEAPTAATTAFEEILAQRDQMITALSRADAQSGAQLAQLFVRYRLAMGEPVGPGSTGRDTAAPPAPPPPAPPPDTVG